jgi:RNA polymerase sigma-70 factor (ECF subfamily)
LPSFRHESPFRFWLLKIAYHHGINAIKGRQENIENFTDEEDSKYLPPEKALLAEEIKKLLMSEIAKLPDKYSICLDLFFFSGLKYKEIGRITGIPQNTIKSHVFRAKQALANSLKGSIAEDYHDL